MFILFQRLWSSGLGVKVNVLDLLGLKVPFYVHFSFAWHLFTRIVIFIELDLKHLGNKHLFQIDKYTFYRLYFPPTQKTDLSSIHITSTMIFSSMASLPNRSNSMYHRNLISFPLSSGWDPWFITNSVHVCDMLTWTPFLVVKFDLIQWNPLW